MAFLNKREPGFTPAVKHCAGKRAIYRFFALERAGECRERDFLIQLKINQTRWNKSKREILIEEFDKKNNKRDRPF